MFLVISLQYPINATTSGTKPLSYPHIDVSIHNLRRIINIIIIGSRLPIHLLWPSNCVSWKGVAYKVAPRDVANRRTWTTWQCSL